MPIERANPPNDTVSSQSKKSYQDPGSASGTEMRLQAPNAPVTHAFAKPPMPYDLIAGRDWDASASVCMARGDMEREIE